jgi:hypothetical protein
MATATTHGSSPAVGAAVPLPPKHGRQSEWRRPRAGEWHECEECRKLHRLVSDKQTHCACGTPYSWLSRLATGTVLPDAAAKCREGRNLFAVVNLIVANHREGGPAAPSGRMVERAIDAWRDPPPQIGDQPAKFDGAGRGGLLLKPIGPSAAERAQQRRTREAYDAVVERLRAHFGLETETGGHGA